MILVDASTHPAAADLRQELRGTLLSMPRWGAKWKVLGRRVRRLERDWVVNGVNCPDADAAVREILKPT